MQLRSKRDMEPQTSAYKEEVTAHTCPHPACCKPTGLRPPKYARLKVPRNVPEREEESSAQPTLYLFTRLPPELQLLVWEHAVGNCFVIYRWVVHRKGGGSARRFRLIKEEKINKTPIIKETRLLCNKRWMKLLPACHMAHDVATKTDCEKRSTDEDKQAYWHRGELYEDRSRYLLSEESKEYRDWLDKLGYEVESQGERDAADIRFYGKNA